MLFFGGFSFVRGEEDLRLCFCFFYVMEEAGRKYVWDMPWPPAAECNMITNKQTVSAQLGQLVCCKEFKVLHSTVHSSLRSSLSPTTRGVLHPSSGPPRSYTSLHQTSKTPPRPFTSSLASLLLIFPHRTHTYTPLVY